MSILARREHRLVCGGGFYPIEECPRKGEHETEAEALVDMILPYMKNIEVQPKKPRGKK